MKTNPSEPRVQRLEPRIPSPGLTLAIVHRKFIWLKDYEYCDLLDINHGGLRLAASWLQAGAGQKLNLELYFEREIFPTRGVVTHASVEGKRHHYGVAFIYAPNELDRLVDIFLREHIASNVAQ